MENTDNKKQRLATAVNTVIRRNSYYFMLLLLLRLTVDVVI